MIFDDRQHAGELLAQKLAKLKLSPRDALIVAIPRGGIVVGKIISQKLGLPLTAIVIKKLGAPNEPELALGATASFGKPALDRWLIGDLKVLPDYLREEVRNKKKEAKTREKFLGISFNPRSFEGKNLILVDDGMATGQTVRAAAAILKSTKPKTLILAIPCASTSALLLVGDYFEKAIVLETSSEFWAVGQFYRDFRPVSDSEVKTILNIKYQISK